MKNSFAKVIPMLVAFFAVVVLGVYVYLSQHPELTNPPVIISTMPPSEEPVANDPSTSTPPVTVRPPTPPTQTPFLPYGDVTLKLGQLAVFKDITVRAVEVVEDSRCPKDVQCIQAGTVRLKVDIAAALGTAPSIITLGRVFTTEGEAITLSAVTPEKNSKVTIGNSDYRFTLHVVKQSVVVTPTPDQKGKCYVGGCSAQLCTDQPDMVSNCMYTAAYACYKTASCERQPSGQCGWTPSKELSACLLEADGKATM